jgi:hypothetical protein
VLDETGVASRCGAAKPTPTTSTGTVRYDVAAFRNPDARAVCVTVTVQTTPRVQVFSAAYRGRFDPLDPRAGYLGDAGTCTNLTAGLAPTTRYSFTVAGRARFVVEVEECSSDQGAVPYTVGVGTANVAYRSASARRKGADVVVRWRTRARASVFVVYRERDGVRRAIATRRSRYEVRDRSAPLGPSLRYWIRADIGGRWSWYGPLAP